MEPWRNALIALAIGSIGCTGSQPEGQAVEAAVAETAIQIDPARVPEDLRPLIPLAERWGIGDDVERGELIAQSSAPDREALKTAVAPHQARITAWLDSFGTGAMSEEAGAFMYMQLAIEEIP